MCEDTKSDMVLRLASLANFRGKGAKGSLENDK